MAMMENDRRLLFLLLKRDDEGEELGLPSFEHGMPARAHGRDAQPDEEEDLQPDGHVK